MSKVWITKRTPLRPYMGTSLVRNSAPLARTLHVEKDIVYM